VTVDDFRLPPQAFNRLRAAVTRFGTQQKLSESTGIPLPTLQKILRGKTDPSFARVAALCQALGLGLDELYHGIGRESGDELTRLAEAGYHPVRRVNVRVSAGNGQEWLSEEVVEHLAFKSTWLQRRLGNPEKLAIVQIVGDSQAPELQSGDLLMIDLTKVSVSEGFHVVRIDTQLHVKWIQIDGPGRLSLTCKNPAYAPIAIDLKRDEDGFNIIGKGVWIGRNI